jgi:hypothetical protein
MIHSQDSIIEKILHNLRRNGREYLDHDRGKGGVSNSKTPTSKLNNKSPLVRQNSKVSGVHNAKNLGFSEAGSKTIRLPPIDQEITN